VQFYGAFEINWHVGDSHETVGMPYSFENGSPPRRTPEVYPSDGVLSAGSAIFWLEISLLLRMLFVLYSDGRLILCSVSKRGLKQTESIKAEKTMGSGDAVCASIASDKQILAVGTRKGTVELYDLSESTSLIRTVSLYDWG